MNGVYRGGCVNTGQVLNVRCGGVRWARVRTYVSTNIGFRCGSVPRGTMGDGVIRGAGLSYASAFRTRVGFRLNGYGLRYSNSDLGFL